MTESLDTPSKTCRQDRLNNEPSQPIQIDCLAVRRVLKDEKETLSYDFSVSGECGSFPLPSGSYSSCSIINVSCEIISVDPALSPSPSYSKLVTVAVTIYVEIKIFNHYGIERCSYESSFTEQFQILIPYHATNTLLCCGYNPTITASTLINGLNPKVATEIELGILIMERVKILIPNYGFCNIGICTPFLPWEIF